MKSEELANPMFAGILVGSIVVFAFIIFMNGFTTLSIIPLAILPLFLTNFNKLKDIKKEIENRNL